MGEAKFAEYALSSRSAEDDRRPQVRACDFVPKLAGADASAECGAIVTLQAAEDCVQELGRERMNRGGLVVSVDLHNTFADLGKRQPRATKRLP